MEQEKELQEISGTVDSVIYKNEENGYTVLRLVDGNGEAVTVTGCFPYAVAGESMIVSGDWMTHSVHGRQFKAEFAQRMMPTSAHAIYDYLAGGSIKGIGPAMASVIVNKFGERTFDVLENSPEELAKIKGISTAKAQQMSKSFRSQLGVRRLMEFVCAFGVRPIVGMRIYRFYGDKALDIIRNNPYVIAEEHIGGTFAEADRMALEMGMDGYSKNRVMAACIFELVHNAGNGHCFIPLEKLMAVTAELIGVEIEDVRDGMAELIENGQIMYEEIAGCRACYLPKLYEAETNASEILARMAKRTFDEHVNIPALIARLESSTGMKYAPLQKDSLTLALRHQLIVLTGGPGTGKTTTIRAILAMFDKLGMTTLLTAPTGRAAKRMTELTGQDAVTIHRLLGSKFAEDGETVVFTKDEGDRLVCDAVILDESSMVDITLIDALLRALPPDCRLVMVGDADQLPSVGPGNVFSSIIRSEVVPTVRLTEIFRQNEGSRIVRNAHMINRGEHPNLSENAGDFFRLRRLEAATSVETITELCATRLPNKMKIPSDDIQVLSPTRRGDMGTASLNKQLQSALNPPSKDKKEKYFGDVVFREGDRVMQIKNNYDIMWASEDNTVAGTGIYNGDIGVLVQINTEQESIAVNFDGRIAIYGFDSLVELEHAWAMTVHKAQGSEYRAVVLALSQSSPMLMTRDVLYTAITRAKELLIIVGDDKAAYTMIDNYKRINRYNALRVRLRKLVGINI